MRILSLFVYLTSKVTNITFIVAKTLVISTAVLWFIRSPPLIKGNLIYNLYHLCLTYFISTSYWYHKSINVRIWFNSYCQEWGFFKNMFCFKRSVLKSHRQFFVCLLPCHCLDLLRFIWVNGIVRNTQKSCVSITELYKFSLFSHCNFLVHIFLFFFAM